MILLAEESWAADGSETWLRANGFVVPEWKVAEWKVAEWNVAEWNVAE